MLQRALSPRGGIVADDELLVGVLLMIPIRWDDDVVFRNQARGTENKGNKEFVNVTVPPCCFCLLGTDGFVSGSFTFRLPQTVHGKTKVSAEGVHWID